MTDLDTLRLRILVINDDAREIESIRQCLDQDMRVGWALIECSNVPEAAARVREADLIILKLEVEGVSRQEVFGDLNDMVWETPIIALTSAPALNNGSDHGLSTFLMEQGAADVMIRGQFARLVDAIEFAMIRQKLKTQTRRDTHQTLIDAEDKSVADLHVSERARSADRERHRQILRMFIGDYSVDSSKNQPRRAAGQGKM